MESVSKLQTLSTFPSHIDTGRCTSPERDQIRSQPPDEAPFARHSAIAPELATFGNRKQSSNFFVAKVYWFSIIIIYHMYVG